MLNTTTVQTRKDSSVVNNNTLLIGGAAQSKQVSNAKTNEFSFAKDTTNKMVVNKSKEGVAKEEKIAKMKEDVDKVSKPLLAVKTNLLFDAATAINLEVEVPIGKRWSVAGEWIFPWWLMESKQYCLQVLSGNIEGRYWFQDRENIPLMTGFFAGVYGGGGLYDIEWGTKGYQGEFFIAAGISGGYAHAINKSKSLRMEYSLGVGYMQTNYREYTPKYGADGNWHLIRGNKGKYTWIGPTRAKVSLVWMINHKVKNGGVK